MAPYAAQLAIHFPYTSADLSATARSAWSMVLALRIAVPVLCEHSVKKPPRRTNHGKSAPFFGPFHPFRLNPLLTLLPLPASVKGRLFSPLLPLFCGETGHVACFVVAGLVCCAHKPSSSPFALFHQKWISPATAMACKAEHNEPIGVSAGSSAWLAMPTHLRHLCSPSRSTDAPFAFARYVGVSLVTAA